MSWTKMFVVVSCLLAMLVIAEQIYSYVCLYDQPDDAAKSPRLDLLDCPKNCGSLKNITYPFGIGPKCFSDPRYEIDCQQNRGPVLKNLSVVVLNISRPASSKSPGLIKVRQPISYSHLNCTSNQQNDAPVNLTASNSVFRYSLRQNYFIAGGCDSLALIASADTPWAVAGCKSSCSRNRTIGFVQCSSGIGCCMTSISDEIGAYNVEFKSLGWEAVAPGDAECRYAFLVERKWWHKADLQSLPRDVPVVLEWEITDYDFNMGPPHCIATFRNVGLSVGGGILPALLCLLYVFINRRRQAKLKQKFFQRNGGLLLQQRLSSIEDNHMEKGELFAFTDLDKATDHFNENRILGQGGQGTVYKGMFMDGTIIAVKKSKVVDAGQVEQFVNEVFILSEINHRNVVKLLGFCLESEVPLLVYEFIPNGTLYQYLHDPDGEFPVSWETRLRIANEVAGALSYLHFAAAIPVYHRDIKSSNILLDDKYRAKVADFGASKSITIDQTHLTTMVRGTFGYLDPEYYQTSQFTDKSDVYSFGVVLVELLTGEKPISQLRAEEGKNLSTYFVISMDENRLFNVLDKEVLDHGDKEEIIAVSNLAKRCLNPNGRHRPTMKEVSTELERVRSLRNPVVIRHNEEEIDRIKTGSICIAASTSMRSEATVELTSWFYDLPR